MCKCALQYHVTTNVLNPMKFVYMSTYTCETIH